MLTEGTEEVSDPSAELQVAQVRINELEVHILTQKAEYERLKQNNDELHVRLEASELQISNTSKEYRMQLHKKEQELIKLRELSRFHEEHGQSFGRRERLDSTDSIEDSMETKRLCSEIARLQADCQHWKSIANGVGNQDKLHKEIDQYQHELTALQSSYSQKISNLNKKHKQELQIWQDEKQEYLQGIEKLEERLLNQNEIEGDNHSDSPFGKIDDNTNMVLSLKRQLVSAENSIVELKRQVKTQEQEMNTLNVELQKKEPAVTATLKNLDDMQAKCQNASEVHDEVMSASERKFNVNIKQLEKLQNQLEDQSKELYVLRCDSESLNKLREELNFVATENTELKEQLNHSQSEERRLHRSAEEVKSELEQLSCSTMDLMEEMQISQGLQQEQKIEMESLKKVKYIKGDAKPEMGKLRSALAALWERHLCLVQLYQQLSTSTVRDDIGDLQQRLVERGQAKLEHVVKEKDAMMGRSAELRVTVEELEGAVMDLQSDNEQVAQETKYCVTEMGRQPGIDEDECSDIVGALHAEKAVLESTIVGLEKKVQDLQELVNSLQNTKAWDTNNECDEGQASRSGSAESVASLTENMPQEGELSIDMGDPRRMSDTSLEPEIRQENTVSLEGGIFPNEDSTLSQELAPSELQEQLQDYQQLVQEFELAQRDWEGEKDALEGLVLSLRRQVKELQVLLANLSKDPGEEEITRLRDENVKILSEKKHLLEAWRTIEEDCVSLGISSPLVGKDSELGEEHIELLREDLNRKDNSLLRVQTERLIQEIEEKMVKVTDLQSELEARCVDVKSVSDEKRDLMVMINERDERICELEESFNNHLLDLTSSKDTEISLLQTEQQDVVNLLEENQQECSLLRNKNNGLLDLMAQHQQAHEELTEKNNSLETLLANKGKHLENLKQEKDNLVTMIQNKEEVNESLTAENNSLLMEKEVLQSLVEEYQEKVKVVQNQTAEKFNQEKELERLNHQIQSSEKRYQDLIAKGIVLSQVKANLELDLSQSTSKLDNVTSELKEKLSEIEILELEKDKLIGSVQSQASTCKELEHKFSESMIEKDEVEKQLAMKDLQLDKLELDLREKGADIDLLKLDIAKLSNALKEKKQLIHTQIVNASNTGPQSSDDAWYRQAQLLRLLEEKDQEIAALKQKDASLIELVSQTDRRTHQAQEAYEDKLHQLREERDKLLGDLSLRDNALLTVEDRLEAMKEKMRGIDQASHLLHTEHARLLALNESQGNEMGKLRERNSSLQKLVEECNRDKTAGAQQIQNDNNQLRHQISELQVEHETLTTLVHEKDKQITTLALLGSSDSPAPSPQGVELQVKRLREERDVLHRERDSAFRDKEMKEIEISQLQGECYSLKQTLQEESKSAANLLAENEEQCKQFSNLQSKLNALSLNKSDLVRSDNRVKELEDEISSFRSAIETKDKELKQVLENSQNEKSSILVELESVKSERDDILEQKCIETGVLKSKILQLVNSLADSDVREEENVDDIDKNFQTLLHTVRNQRNSALRERDNEIQSLREQLSNVTILNKATEAHGSELEEVLRDKEELHRMLLQARDEKEDLLHEKESAVADLQDQIVSLSRAVSEKQRASHQELQHAIQEKERIINELDQAQKDREDVNSVNSHRQAEISRLQAELHELKGVVTQEQDTISKVHREVDQYKMALQEKDRILKDMMVEREQLQRTQEQLQHRVQQLQEELSTASSGQKVAETKMVQELERLRNHLVQVEESYTREALEAEEREKDLRMKLSCAEEQLLSSSHSMLDRDRQASVQIENLQEQLQAIATQRDRAVMDLASIQEQAHQYQTSLNNLQLVLEQFQRERESQLRATQEQAEQEIGKAWVHVKELQQRENQLKSQLEMAARITQELVTIRNQLKCKDDELIKYQEEVTRLEDELRVSQERINNLNSMSDSKVEKFLVKNMLMGYFNTPENKRVDVVRVIGGVLGFSHEELDKVGTGSSAPKGSWISNLIPFGHGAPKTPTRTTASVQKSFSELFVSFLESESEVPRSSSDASVRVSNPLLSGMTPQQSTASHVPGGLPIATSTPIGTPARNNLTPLPPSAMTRPLTASAPSDGMVRANSSGMNGNPLLVGSLTQELPALSSSGSLRTLLEGRT
ncbi:Thyroid receptor-interacting protein 11 [Desmophyllum pertusum]|uniref:Thyroid receptor-interacting protein 11 n=1 Tax=Desmophyllum pertusum TaxID=174260 RepID=A0A9W9Z467_9CNID|nr:Thyroid receptor-interacting protein 11 [Desmophyllum pertusum]